MDVEAIREGMTVYSSDGEKLGKIIGRDGDTLVIEKGLFFKKDYLASTQDVNRVDDDEVWLLRTRAELESPTEPAVSEPDAEFDDTPPVGRAPTSRAEAGMSAAAAQESADDLKAIPSDVVVVVREEIDVVAVPSNEVGAAPGERPPRPRGTDRDPDTRE